MKAFPTTNFHRLFKHDLDKVIKRHSKRLSDQEIIAVTSQVLGIIIGMQDKDKGIKLEQAFELIAGNIAIGKQTVENNLRITH